MSDEKELWQAARKRMEKYVSAVFWQDFGIGGEAHDRSVNWKLDRIFRPEFFGATDQPVWRVMQDDGSKHIVVARGLSRAAADQILKRIQESGEKRFHWMEPKPDDEQA